MEPVRSLAALYHRGRRALRVLRGEDLMEAAADVPRVIQLVSCLNYGDAVGNEVAAIGGILRRNWCPSEVWTGWKHPQWSGSPVRILSQLPPLRPEDLVLYHFASECPFAGQIPQLPCRVLLRYHNVTPSSYFHGYDARAESATANALRQLPALLERVDGCIPASHFSGRDLSLHGYRGPMAVMPVLLQWGDYTRSPDEEWLRRYGDGVVNVLSVGRLAPNKHLEDVISAYAIFRQRCPHSRLILAGSSPAEDAYGAFLRRHIQALGVENVVFTGHIRFEQLLALYRTADVYLCMSGHEGFCVPLIESMAFGVPIVACRGSAVTETVGDAGLLFDRGSFAAMAEGMERVIAQRPLWQQREARRLREFGYERAEEGWMEALHLGEGARGFFPFDSGGKMDYNVPIIH